MPVLMSKGVEFDAISRFLRRFSVWVHFERGAKTAGAYYTGAVAKQHPNPKEKTEPVHCESGDTGSVFW